MLKEFRHIIFLVFVLFIGGSVGYSLIEKWNFFDSLYMTIITISTTGFKEIKPLSDAGKIFTMIVIVFGMSILFYAIGNLNIAIFEKHIFRDKKMQKNISNLENHYIICGFGRMGKKIAQELDKRSKVFVIIERDEESLKQCKKYLYIKGDATEDENLINAGIAKAMGLVCVLSDDIANVFSTLSARGLNSDLKIISRAEEESSKGKLLKAGASRVMLPYEIGGFRIAQALLKPNVVDYVDEIFSRSDIGLEIEEIKLAEGSEIIGKTVAESAIRSNLNVIIIGIYRSEGELIYNPQSQTKLNLNDTLIVIGRIEELKKLQRIANHYEL